MTSILTDESVHSRIRTTQKPAARSAFSSWCVGFITNISNPKAVVFFSSLFVVALPADPPLWVRVASFIVMALISLGWYSTVACLFSMEPVIKIYQKAKRGIDYVTGGIFIVLAISIILVR
jgi:threonine efflux protein